MSARVFGCTFLCRFTNLLTLNIGGSVAVLGRFEEGNAAFGAARGGRQGACVAVIARPVALAGLD